MKVAASPRSMAQVAAVLAFVISHTTFFSAQDDEMRRTTPAKPFEPVEPAPLFYKQSRGSTPPGANLRTSSPHQKGVVK